MRKFLFLLLPIVFSCFVVKNIALKSEINPNFVRFENGTIKLYAGDKIDLSFVLDAKNCLEDLTRDLKIVIGSKEILRTRKTIASGSLETVHYEIEIPEDLEGYYTLKIVFEDDVPYETSVDLFIEKLKGGFLIEEVSPPKTRFGREGQVFEDEFKIYCLKRFKRIIFYLNDEIQRDFVFSRGVNTFKVSYVPKNGINILKFCDEEENCYSFERIFVLNETTPTNVTTKVEKEAGEKKINPLIILILAIILALVVWRFTK